MSVVRYTLLLITLGLTAASSPVVAQRSIDFMPRWADALVGRANEVERRDAAPSSQPAPLPESLRTIITPSAAEALMARVKSPAAHAGPAPAPAPLITPTNAQVARAARPHGATRQPMRHLTNNIQGFRLSGEIGQSEWPIYVTDRQAHSRLRFQVSYLSSVSVMPEASFLTVLINDRAIGRVNITGSHGVKTNVHDIPAGLLKPGFNSVRLVAEQRHRVDCSIKATYELWTQIDPGATGLVLSDDDVGIADFSDIAALLPDREGALPIRVVLPPRTGTTAIERAVTAVQVISLAGRFQQPTVDVGLPAAGGHGINLVVGTAEQVTGVLPGVAFGAVPGARVIVLPPEADRRTTIIVTGRTDNEVQVALASMTAGEELRGSPEGLRAASAFPGYRVEGGQRVRLRDVGLISQEFSGRLFKVAFNIVMPPDFYSADYAKAILDLAGGYAPGLSNHAQIVVSVNGRNAVSQKLPKSSGDVFRENPIPLRLGALKPGLNRIEIEAQVPTAGDAECDAIKSVDGRHRFLFLDTSELILPQIARIARMPDLAVTATGGFPFVGGAGRALIHVPAPSGETLGAAMSLAANLALAAGKVIDFGMTLKTPEAGAGPTIVVSPFAAIEPSVLKAVGLDEEMLTKTWRTMIDQPLTDVHENLTVYQALSRQRLILQRNYPAACHIPGFGGQLSQAAQAGARKADAVEPIKTIGVAMRTSPETPLPSGDGARDLMSEWNKDIKGGAKLMERASAALDGVWTGALDSVGAAQTWFGRQLEQRAAPISSETPLVIAQGFADSASNDIRMVVTAPTAELLARAVPCLLDPRIWQQIAGRMSVLHPGEAVVRDVPVENARLVPTQPLSVGNVRLIIAGWFSLNIKAYVALALVAGLLLAATTTMFLRNVGRKHEC